MALRVPLYWTLGQSSRYILLKVCAEHFVHGPAHHCYGLRHRSVPLVNCSSEKAKTNESSWCQMAVLTAKSLIAYCTWWGRTCHGLGIPELQGGSSRPPVKCCMTPDAFDLTLSHLRVLEEICFLNGELLKTVIVRGGFYLFILSSAAPNRNYACQSFPMPSNGRTCRASMRTSMATQANK